MASSELPILMRGAAIAAALVIICGNRIPAAAQDGDATTLFRDEIIDAPLRIHVKESSLSDETRFAVAASGISWHPTWNDHPLIMEKGRWAGYADGPFRVNAFQEARKARASKISFAFALSLVLEPPEGDDAGWKSALDYLRGYGADFDKALVGILTASDRLPLLYEYRHAAADVMLWRASPRLLPIFLGMATTDDRYLRSRAIVGLGLVGYRSGTGLEDSVKGLRVDPREMGISAVQESMIDEVVRKAAEDKDFRVRAAAALALSLTGDRENQAILQKLLKDRAYIEPMPSAKGPVEVTFPVRAQAARGLERWGTRASEESGTYDSRSAAKAVRGAQNITNEARDARKKVEHTVPFNEADW